MCPIPRGNQRLLSRILRRVAIAQMQIRSAGQGRAVASRDLRQSCLIARPQPGQQIGRLQACPLFLQLQGVASQRRIVGQ